MKMHTRLAVVAGLPLLLLAGQVSAQSTKQRVTTLEEKLARTERLLENSQSVQTDMLGRIQQLQSENQELRNELETLQFESTRSADRQRQLYMDLDTRLQGLEAGGGGSAGVAPVPGQSAPAVSDREAYQAAFDELREGRYEPAGKGFELFLAEYPNSELRDNAQYWLAETRYVTKQFESALAGFQKVITEYPASRKISDAWLKVGYCNYELKKWADARQALVTASSQYPDSTAGKLAKERLALMDKNGV